MFNGKQYSLETDVVFLVNKMVEFMTVVHGLESSPEGLKDHVMKLEPLKNEVVELYRRLPKQDIEKMMVTTPYVIPEVNPIKEVFDSESYVKQLQMETDIRVCMYSIAKWVAAFDSINHSLITEMMDKHIEVVSPEIAGIFKNMKNDNVRSAERVSKKLLDTAMPIYDAVDAVYDMLNSALYTISNNCPCGCGGGMMTDLHTVIDTLNDMLKRKNDNK